MFMSMFERGRRFLCRTPLSTTTLFKQKNQKKVLPVPDTLVHYHFFLMDLVITILFTMELIINMFAHRSSKLN